MPNLSALGFMLDEQTLTIPGLTRTYTLVHVSDAHLCPDAETDTPEQRAKSAKGRQMWATPSGAAQEEMLLAARAYAAEIGADLFCCTGDMINACYPSNFAVLRDCLIGCDHLLYAPGNHEETPVHRADVNTAYPNDLGFRVCDLGEIIVAAVDNSTHSIADADYARLKALLAGDKPVILTQHVPLDQPDLCIEGGKKWRDLSYFIFGRSGNWEKKDDYYDLLTGRQTALRAVLCGHLHITHLENFPNGVPQYVAAPCFTGYMRVLTIKG